MCFNFKGPKLQQIIPNAFFQLTIFNVENRIANNIGRKRHTQITFSKVNKDYSFGNKKSHPAKRWLFNAIQKMLLINTELHAAGYIAIAHFKHVHSCSDVADVDAVSVGTFSSKS